MLLLSEPERSTDVIDQLHAGSQEENHKILMWLLEALKPLALSKSTCRVVQKAFEVANSTDRDMLIAELKDHVEELYLSPHGNHVLSRAIEVLPATKADFVISALRGRCPVVAKHRYGCRVFCRLLEHCGEEHIGGLLDELMPELAMLSRHAFGNFVVQAILEHLPARHAAVLSQILPVFPDLVSNRAGSLVAQRVLAFCDTDGQRRAIQALLQSPSPLINIACTNYGSYVIEQVAGMAAHRVAVEGMACILANNLERLHASEHGLRVVAAFRLPPAILLVH